MRYKLIYAEKALSKASVRRLCRWLRVSESGYYEWLKRGPPQRELEDVKLASRLEKNHLKHRQRYGSRRHTAELRRQGESVGRNRVRRLMRDCALKALKTKQFRRTTDSEHRFPVAPNLLARNFSPGRPNEAWVCDITFIRTTDGWLYLAVILDLYSRKVIGWSMGERITRRLVIQALEMAVKRRETRPGTLVHSDQGSQYASKDHRQELDKARLVCSMSRRANCWDNAVAESFFATLETEVLDPVRGNWNRDEARKELFHFMEVYYNRDRLHSTLGYKTPVEYEEGYIAQVRSKQKKAS